MSCYCFKNQITGIFFLKLESPFRSNFSFLKLSCHFDVTQEYNLIVYLLIKTIFLKLFPKFIPNLFLKTNDKFSSFETICMHN